LGSNYKRFNLAITPLSLKSFTDKRSDDELGWATILDIDPQKRVRPSLLRTVTIPTDKKQRSRYLAGNAAFSVPKGLRQFRSLSPLAAEAITAATADDPVEVGVGMSGVASAEIFQAVSVTIQNQID
jgi:uncharacterized protein YuzE